MTHPLTPTSQYFPERPDLQIDEDEVVLVSNCRNELQRLPYFLEYYRHLGVDRFLIIDNNSDDGTAEFLQAQPDVEYFFTDASYRGALSGRLWTQELADTYAVDRWVLTADADELLVFPGMESVSLRELCAYLDHRKVRGLYAFMLDMYADVPLSEAVYETGTDFLDTCGWFEVDTYHLSPGQYPPFLRVEGGPRSSLYDNRPQVKGPESTKVPLVKWFRGFSYVASSHNHRYLPLGDVTGVLLHFKFFSIWKSVVMRDAQRGDQIGFYDKYAEEYGSADPNYWRPESVKFTGPAQLVELGVISTTSAYVQWLEKTRAEEEVEYVPGSEAATPVGLSGAPRLDLRSFSQVWELFNNPNMAAYFGSDERVSDDTRKNLMKRFAGQVSLVDVLPDRLLLDLRHPVLHVGRNSGIELVLYVDDREVATLPFDGTAQALRVDMTSLNPNTYEWDVDVAGIVGQRDAHLALYVRDRHQPRDPGEIVGDDQLVHARVWSWAGGTVDPDRVRGMVESVVDGRLKGWIFDHDHLLFRVPLAVRINGRLVAHVLPWDHRPELKSELPPGVRRRPVGFSVALPLGFFEDHGAGDLCVEVTVAGSNQALTHAPLTLPAGVRSMWWDAQAGEWSLTDPATAVTPTEPAAPRPRTGRIRAGLSRRLRRRR